MNVTGCRLAVLEPQRTLRVAAEENRIARRVRGHFVREPHRALADGRAEFVERLRLHEPQVRLRLAGRQHLSLRLPRIEELALRRHIAAEDDAIIPPAEIAGDT